MSWVFTTIFFTTLSLSNIIYAENLSPYSFKWRGTKHKKQKNENNYKYVQLLWNKLLLLSVVISEEEFVLIPNNKG